MKVAVKRVDAPKVGQVVGIEQSHPGDPRGALARTPPVPPELVAALQDFLSSQRSPDTRRTFRSALSRWAAFLGSRGLDPRAAGPGDVAAFRDQALAAGKTAATVAKDLSAVRLFYAFLEGAGLAQRNPAKVVRGPRVDDRSTKGFLSVAECELLLAAPDASSLIGRRDRAILALLAVNGLRLVEIRRSEVRDLFRVDGHRVLRVRGKGGRTGDAKIRADVAAAIDAWGEARAAEIGAPRPGDPLFCSTRGSPGARLTTRGIFKRVSMYMDRVGLRGEGITPHSLRHSAVTHPILEGASVQQAQILARHANINTTMRYFHNVHALADAAVDRNPVRVA